MCDEDETLLRYHFGDMSCAEYTAFEERLAAEPKLVERLERLRECLAAHDPSSASKPNSPCGESADVPKQLADRTTTAILAAKAPGECCPTSQFGVAETAVVVIAAALLLTIVTPALQASRDAARRATCSQNLNDIYHSLAIYERENASRFPEIGPSDNAGLFSVMLADRGYSNREELAERLVCPASELARQIAANRAVVVVPTRIELRVGPAMLVDRMRRFMGGSMAYRFGHVEGDDYVCPPSRGDCRTPLMADAPGRSVCGVVVSNNHGECGQNVLFEDGHVSFVTGCWAPGRGDHLFLNTAGEVAAGRCPSDTVLAPSEATPAVLRPVHFEP